HFGLSMLMMVAAVGLVWNARHEPGWREPSTDRLVVWWTRVLAAIGAAALFTGTLATAAGPHAGGKPGSVERFEPKGGETLRWIVMNHGHFAEALGVLALVLWFVLRRRNAPRDLQRAITNVVLLVGAQGVVGMLQWRHQLPAELVWIHIVLATATWVAILWATFTAGRLARR
ncbi:MAG: hypothetical protein JHC87_08170, partial [Thermoleophilaceae bacterium]|nr:hypothetical protein [Thermoleophilaceae bacterium]